MRNHTSLLLFLVGLFANFRVHIVGMIGLSEFAMAVAAPFLLVRNYHKLKSDGFLPIIKLLALTILGCLISSYVNHTPFQNWIRGVAAPVVFLTSIISIHHLVRNNLNGMKWLFVGYLLSGLVAFILQGQSVTALLEEGEVGLEASADVMRMYLLMPLLTIPLYCMYTKIHWAVSVSWACFIGVYTIISTTSGRSAAVVLLAGAALIAVGRKSVRRMKSMSKHFVLYVVLSLVFVFAIKSVYTICASNGLLGEAAQQKYAMQTKSGNSLIRLLIGGRAEAFVCFYAALDKPIVGFGPWPLDNNEYSERFFEMYGDPEDVAKHKLSIARLRQSGYGAALLRCIPAHSHIFGNWVWYGIFGLLLWVYVIYIFIRHFAKNPDAIPQWHGIIAMTVPSTTWAIFFSPVGTRVRTAAIICTVLVCRAVAKGSIRFNHDSWTEREKYLP